MVSLYTEGQGSGVSDEGIPHRQTTTIDQLPEVLIREILSRLFDATDLARASSVNRSFRTISRLVRSVKFLCTRNNIRRGTGQDGRLVTSFGAIVRSKLSLLECVERLRLEIDDVIQASQFEKEIIEGNSLWLTEDKFILEWLPLVCNTLQSLAIIDYGRQAIFQQTKLLHRLSQDCKQLRTLELRNLYLGCTVDSSCSADQTNLARLPGVTTLTLRCVKLPENGLSDLAECMPNLTVLTLVTVVGLSEARLKSEHLEVLCLGLVTKVKSVDLDVVSLQKLQLKMTCPEELRVKAPRLECLAICVDKHKTAKVDFQEVKQLRELVMGTSEFSLLTEIIEKNRNLKKLFLDVPCMLFEDNGAWKGVSTRISASLPDMKDLKDKCSGLNILSVGPGLWYCLEQNFKENRDVFNPLWPALDTLIVHLVVEDVELSWILLKTLVDAISSLRKLCLFVHTDSKVDLQNLGLSGLLPSSIYLTVASWKKGLNFDCFSF